METYLDKKTFLTVLAVVVFVMLAMYVYHHFISTSPVGSLSASQYGQLPAASQKNYYQTSSGMWVPLGS